MIPREILKKIRQIEIRTNGIVNSKLLLCVTLALSGIMFARDSFADEDWPAIVSHNIKVRLTGVSRNKEAPFNLVARFVTEDRAAREFTVEFPENPPDAHVATIMNVIEHSISPTRGDGHSKWLPLDYNVLLSVPPGTGGVVTNFTKWGIFTVSVPSYLTAHWAGEVVPIDKVIEQSERIVVAKCVSTGPMKASLLSSVGFEVEHVIIGTKTNRQFAAESYGHLLPGKSYLICFGKRHRAGADDRLVIGNDLFPILEAGWSSEWDGLLPKEQLTKIIAARMAQLKYGLENARTEYERLQKILQASYPDSIQNKSNP